LTVVEADATADTIGLFTAAKVAFSGTINAGTNMKFLDPATRIVIGWNPDFLLASAW
jgi:hypothetical protein